MILDTALIRRRRGELGLSERALSTQLGVSPNVIAARSNAGTTTPTSPYASWSASPTRSCSRSRRCSSPSPT